MLGMEEQQITFDENSSPIVKAEVILTDGNGQEYRITLQHTVQRVVTAQLATRRLVDVPEGCLMATNTKVGMVSATIHLTGMVQESTAQESTESTANLA